MRQHWCDRNKARDACLSFCFFVCLVSLILTGFSGGYSQNSRVFVVVFFSSKDTGHQLKFQVQVCWCKSGAVCCGDDTVTQARFNYRMGSSYGLAHIHCVPVCDGDQ